MLLTGVSVGEWKKSLGRREETVMKRKGKGLRKAEPLQHVISLMVVSASAAVSPNHVLTRNFWVSCTNMTSKYSNSVFCKTSS